MRLYERQAGTYMTLGNETVHMLKYLSGEIGDPFLRPEIIDRLAAMLDYNLVQLVGPKCTDLKVKNPEKYQFQPKKLLGEIIDIFVNLSSSVAFVEAIGRDGRSYRKEYFEKAAGILRRNVIRPEEVVEQLLCFVGKVESFIQQQAKEDEELGDIPDEFMGNKIKQLYISYYIYNDTISHSLYFVRSFDVHPDGRSRFSSNFRCHCRSKYHNQSFIE